MNTQLSFMSLGQKKVLKKEQFFVEMEKIVPWADFIKVVEPYYEEKKVGRKKTDLLLMLKIMMVQKWQNLSDPQMEETIYDSYSIQKFLEIDLLANTVPDETTICNFRHLLEEHNLTEKIFASTNTHLEEKGITVKKGTLVDATIIHAPSSTKNKKKERDPEMSSTKKGGVWHFGMKAHIGVDTSSGLIHTVRTTTASVHDKEEMMNLLHGEESFVGGDKGYVGKEDKKAFRARGIVWGVLDKASRGNKLSGKQEKRNKKLSSIRSKVEHPFNVMKNQWKYTKVRYRGLAKNTADIFLMCSLVNLYKARKRLLLLA